MSQYVISGSIRYNRLYAFARFCEIDPKTDKIKSVQEISIGQGLSEALSKSSNFNLVFTIPICHSDYSPIPIMGVYIKRQLNSPEMVILYSHPNSNDRRDHEIEFHAYKYCNDIINSSLPQDKIKSLNLNAILNVVMKDNSKIKDPKFTYHHHYLGFDLRFSMNYKVTGEYNYINDSTIQECVEHIKLRLFSINNVKSSMNKFIDQLQSIIYYDQINRDVIINLMNKMGHTIKTWYSKVNITDIINSNKFATLDDDFVEYYNNINWDNGWQEFKEIVDITDIVNAIDTKSINIRGIQFIIKNKIICIVPSILDSNLNDINKLKLGYAILTYFDKYDDLLNAISLIKLRSLSVS